MSDLSPLLDDVVTGLSLRELSFVVEVAEQRSFTAAAQSLHMSQSALSRSVNETEKRVGVRLFRRTTRSVELTPEGEEFVRLARELLSAQRRMLSEFTLFREGLSGHVRVASLPSVAAVLLPPLLAELRHRTPRVQVSVDDTHAHRALEQLLAGHADYAITTDDWLPAGVRFTPLSTDAFRVVFRSDHRFHGSAAVRWHELAQEDLAVFSASSSIRSQTDRVFTDLRISARSTIEAQNIAVVAGLVAAGLGVAAVPETVLPLMQFAGLESATLVDPTVERMLGLVEVIDRPTSAAARAFADLLIESAAPSSR